MTQRKLPPNTQFPLCFHPPLEAGYQAPSLSESVSMWIEWNKADVESPTGKSGYCEDCLPEYKKQEVAASRCRYPRTTFHVPDPANLDDGVYGERYVDLRQRTDGPQKQARHWATPNASGKISLGMARAKARQSAVEKKV